MQPTYQANLPINAIHVKYGGIGTVEGMLAEIPSPMSNIPSKNSHPFSFRAN